MTNGDEGDLIRMAAKKGRDLGSRSLEVVRIDPVEPDASGRFWSA